MGVVEGVKMELDDCAFPLLTSQLFSPMSPAASHRCNCAFRASVMLIASDSVLCSFCSQR